MQVSNDELFNFWHGDEDSFGYLHESIPYELSRRLKPKGPREILNFLHPGLSAVEDVPLDERRMIDRGYLKWKNPSAYADKYWKKAPPSE